MLSNTATAAVFENKGLLCTSLLLLLVNCTDPDQVVLVSAMENTIYMVVHFRKTALTLKNASKPISAV